MSDLQAKKQWSKPAKRVGAVPAAAGKTAPKGSRAGHLKAKKLLLKRRRRQMRIVLALAGLIVILLALCGWQFAEYRGFQHKRAVVDGDTFFDGVFVEGVDVSAMSLEEALTYWEENIEPVHAARTVVLSDGTKLSLIHI